MWDSTFRYYAALSAPSGEALANVRLDVDWVPAVRWAEFEPGLRDAREPARDGTGGGSARAVVEPRWSASRGRPYVAGVSIRTGGGGPVDFPLSYFSSAVGAAATELVTAGTLVDGQRFDYEVYALAESSAVAPRKHPLGVTAIDPWPPVEEAALEPLLARACPHPADDAATAEASRPERVDTLPILIPERVLDETTALAEQAGDVETGGILVGNLCRAADGRLFARVTAQIPAEHTRATRDSLRFTPRTWVSVEAAIKLRGRREIPLGWWHDHPFFCRRCPPARRSLCPFSVPTFSRDDRHLHREVFQKPWSIALLLTFLGEPRPSYDVFGWNRGRIQALRFLALRDEPNPIGETP